MKNITSMRIFFIITIAFFAISSFSQTSWITQQSGTTENLTSVFFMDSLTGIIVGQNHAILHSAGTHQVTIRAESLPNGVYMYRLTTSDGNALSRRMLVNK